jgi:hypothetical protein
MNDFYDWLSGQPGWLQIFSTALAIIAVGLLACTANFMKHEAVESLEAKIAETEARNLVQFERILKELRELARRTIRPTPTK